MMWKTKEYGVKKLLQQEKMESVRERKRRIGRKEEEKELLRRDDELSIVTWIAGACEINGSSKNITERWLITCSY